MKPILLITLCCLFFACAKEEKREMPEIREQNSCVYCHEWCWAESHVISSTEINGIPVEISVLFAGEGRQITGFGPAISIKLKPKW